MYKHHAVSVFIALLIVYAKHRGVCHTGSEPEFCVYQSSCGRTYVSLSIPRNRRPGPK